MNSGYEACRVCGDNSLELQLCANHLYEYHDWKRLDGDDTPTNRVNEFVDLCDEIAGVVMDVSK